MADLDVAYLHALASRRVRERGPAAPAPMTAAQALALTEMLLSAPKVVIEETRGEPTTCDVWRSGRLVFSGVSRSALLEVPRG
jgi:hypothetical protein